MRVMKKNMKYLLLAISLVFMLSFVSAGVGISWDKESALIPEKTKTCLTYKVYNPWDKDVYAKIELSDALQEIVSSYENEVKFIPKETSSAMAIPVNFCFKTSKIYKRNCWIGNRFICKQECTEDMKVYSGEVEVIEISEAAFEASGAGGSATQMSISAPLKIRVQCIAHDRDYSLIYIVIALISGGLLFWNVKRKKKDLVKGKKNKK
jgi:hypothetical protein